MSIEPSKIGRLFYFYKWGESINQIAMTLREFWSQFVDTFGRPALAGAPARPPNMPIPAFIEGFANRFDGQRWSPPPTPYIIYPNIQPSFRQNALFQVSVWDRTPGNPGMMAMIYDVLGQIEKAIPTETGVILKLDDNSGAVWLMRSNPFILNVPTGEDDTTWTRGTVGLIARGLII